MNERTNEFDTLGYALLIYNVILWLKQNWPWIAGAVAAYATFAIVEGRMHRRRMMARPK